MAYSIYDTTKFRKELLNGGDFNEIHFNFIKTNEGFEYCAYDDSKKRQAKYIKDIVAKGLKKIGRATVGIGYNMENGDSEWVKAFKHLRDKMPNFLDVKEGRACLETDEQVKMLFEVNVKTRIKKLTENYYRNEWQYMTPNEQLAIEDLFFNTEIGLVTNTLRKDDKGKYIKTNFYKNFPLYIAAKRNGDMELAKLYLDVCLWEVKHHSNGGDTDLQQRRDSEAAMLNTYDAKITKERTATVIEEEISAIIKKREAQTTSNPMSQGGANSIVKGFIESLTAYLSQYVKRQNILKQSDIAVIEKQLMAYLSVKTGGEHHLKAASDTIASAIKKAGMNADPNSEMMQFVNMGLSQFRQLRSMGGI